MDAQIKSKLDMVVEQLDSIADTLAGIELDEEADNQILYDVLDKVTESAGLINGIYGNDDLDGFEDFADDDTEEVY